MIFTRRSAHLLVATLFLFLCAFFGCDRELEESANHPSENQVDPDPDPDPGANQEEEAPPQLSPVRRLTEREYNLTLEALFPDLGTLDYTLARGSSTAGFDTEAQFQQPSALLMEQLRLNAFDVVTRLQEHLPELLPCESTSPDDPAQCGADFIAEFGFRAFRRPLSEEEQTRFEAFFLETLEEENFAVAAKLVIQAMLQSPAFVYRLEFGHGEPDEDLRVTLTPYELASRLSYFLWQTMPDEELFSLAESGELLEPAVLEAQARRMLEDARARASILDFHAQWIDADRILQVNKDAYVHPDFNDTLRHAMRQEFDFFLEHIVFDAEGTLEALLTSPETYVNRPLARLYDVEGPAEDGWEFVTLDPQERAGLLTRASFLASHAHAVHPSPVLRGYTIIKQLLCVPVPTPPGDVDTTPPDESFSDHPTTNRERYEVNTKNPACSSCHGAMDGIGFGFEHYDSLGAYRFFDNGLRVDASGELIGLDVSGSYYGAVELSEMLASSRDVKDCFTRQWFRYGFGRFETREDFDRETLTELQVRFAESEGDILELLVAMTSTRAFRTRAALN